MKYLKNILILGALLFTCASAQAFQVVLDGSGTNALHIKNLDIGGTIYDVSFVDSLPNVGTVRTCPNYPCDPFDGDQAGANNARDIIALALNENVGIGGSGSPVVLTVGPSLEDSILVPWLFDANSCFNAGGVSGTCASRGVKDSGAGTWEPLFGTAEIISSEVVTLARFSPGGTVVPVPAAAWLFGSALGLLGWVRRRNRSALSSHNSSPDGRHMV
jgi:hypothetical protein